MFVERDNEGYLLDPADWNVRLAEDVAREENIQLAEDHWCVVTVFLDLRGLFYHRDSQQTGCLI